MGSNSLFQTQKDLEADRMGERNFKEGPEGDYIGSLMKGTVSVIDLPTNEELKTLTEKVIANNFSFTQAETNTDNPIPLYEKEKDSPIKYIVFISKENRTYDEVFGQVKNGIGDSSLARYGDNVTFSNEKGDVTIAHATIMPNHLALAEQFTISDNFYVDADVSSDGHRWLSGTYPKRMARDASPCCLWWTAEHERGLKCSRKIRNDRRGRCHISRRI